jgi:ParB family chromosome partitioning protein
MDTKLDNATDIGKNFDDSRATVFRYIRLTELIPEILDMVDEKRIAFRPAVEISYLSEENQYVLLDIMQFSDITPSLAQAIHMKKLQQENKLDTEKLEDIMSQEKANQIEKLKFNAERFESVFPKNIVSNQQKEDFVFMCVQEHNQRERAKKMARER